MVKLDRNFYVEVSYVYTQFVPWFKNNFPSYRVPDHKKFTNGTVNPLRDSGDRQMVWHLPEERECDAVK